MPDNKKERSTLGKWTRRGFLGIGGLLGVGLVVGVGGYAYLGRAIKKYSGKGLGDGTSLNAWINIAPDNKVTLAIARAEMGQGVMTAVAQLIAEELEVNWEDIQVIHPQPESPYANTFVTSMARENAFEGFGIMGRIASFLPLIVTGGSTTVIDAWTGMRYAGATAREMLISAAADQWGIDRQKCKAENGQVINMDTKESISYGKLSEAAINFKSDQLPVLKKRSEFKLVSKPVKRLDIPAKVNGSAKFSLDIKQDGMLYAAVKHASRAGHKITRIENEEAILKMPGVKKVLVADTGQALVIADNTWRAMNAAKSLKVQEDHDSIDPINSSYISSELHRIADEKPIATKLEKGNPIDIIQGDLSEGQKLVEASYEVPYLAHACMEPLNGTAIMQDGKMEVWIGHQSASAAQGSLAEASGLKKKDITINITYLGGGFGRRGEPDFAYLTGVAAKAMPGKMVQMVFSREETTKNGTYRPGAVCKMQGVIDTDGTLKAYNANVAVQCAEAGAIGRLVPMAAPGPGKAMTTLEGIDNQAYKIPNQKAGFGDFQSPIRVGFWRSVANSQNGFFQESFIDECAAAAEKDPLQFRLSMLKDSPRETALLNKVAQMSSWGNPSDPDLYQGIAILHSFHSTVAEVAEIRKISDKEFKIENYYCAIDCGNTVNPDTIESQMQSGIIYGLTAALYGAITWEDGKVDQSNFHDYPMLKMANTPNIEVAIMDVDAEPGGVGEPGTPPAAPALCNALFKATGERVRTLPLSKSGYTFV